MTPFFYRDLTLEQADRDREERELARQELNVILEMEQRGDFGDKPILEWREYVRSVWEKAYGGPEPLRPKGEPLPTPEELEEAEYQARKNRHRASPEQIWQNQQMDEKRAQEAREQALAQHRMIQERERGLYAYNSPIG